MKSQVSAETTRYTSFSSKHVCFKASHMYPSIEKSSHSDNDGMLVCLGNVVTFFLICAADETPVWILSSAFDIWHAAVLRFFFSLYFGASTEASIISVSSNHLELHPLQCRVCTMPPPRNVDIFQTEQCLAWLWFFLKCLCNKNAGRVYDIQQFALKM